MANNDNVQIKIVGTVGSSALVNPRVTPKSEVPQYQVNLQNPSFDNNDMQNQDVVNAIQQLKLRVQQPTAEYPNPSIFIGLPAHNKNSSDPNVVRFYDLKTRAEKQITQEPALGQQVEVYVDTYHTDNQLAAKYGSRAVRLKYVLFQDFTQVKWFSPSNQGLAGFTSLTDQAGDGVVPTAPAAQPAPQFNGNTQSDNPFGPQKVAPSETNPLLPNNQPAQAAGTAPASNAQSNPFGAAPTAPAANPQAGQAGTTQAAPSAQPNPFGAAGTTPAANPQAAAPNAQPNPFGATGAAPASNTQANPFGATPNPQDPFAGNGAVNVSDEDLPF